MGDSLDDVIKKFASEGQKPFLQASNLNRDLGLFVFKNGSGEVLVVAFQYDIGKNKLAESKEVRELKWGVTIGPLDQMVTGVEQQRNVVISSVPEPGKNYPKLTVQSTKPSNNFIYDNSGSCNFEKSEEVRNIVGDLKTALQDYSNDKRFKSTSDDDALKTPEAEKAVNLVKKAAEAVSRCR